MKLQKIISGGQTGVDTYALEIAAQLGIPTGGTAPRYYLTERGANTELKKYGLVEHSSMLYPPRTEANILNSDGTLLLGNPNSNGSKLTIGICKKHGRSILINPTGAHFAMWLERCRIKTLNIAGNRGSRISAAEQERLRKRIHELLWNHRRLTANEFVHPGEGVIPRF